MATASDIRLVHSLGDKEARREAGLFVVEGEKMTGEVLTSGMHVTRLFSTNDRAGAEHVSPKEMERMSRLKTPSSVLAVVEIPSWQLDRTIFNNELVLALDNVQDPGNVGTIIRTADWFGIRNLICSPTTTDCFNPKVIQATMGAIFRVRVHYGSLPTLLNGINPVFGTFLDGANIYDAALSHSGVIVMGSEGQGISADVAQLVTNRLYIPSFATSGTESLNVASATAIVCAEFRRRG